MMCALASRNYISNDREMVDYSHQLSAVSKRRKIELI